MNPDWIVVCMMDSMRWSGALPVQPADVHRLLAGPEALGTTLQTAHLSRQDKVDLLSYRRVC
jgi:hypothetical protein